MGRKAGRAGGQSGAKRGRDQIPRSAPPKLRPPPTELPQPQHAAASPVREACFFFMVAWPSPLLTPAPPAPSHQTCPLQGFVQGVPSL